MIPYYREVEHLEDFPLYLKNSYGLNDLHYVENAKIPDYFYKKYERLFKEAKLLSFLAKITSFERIPAFSYEEWDNLGFLLKKIDDVPAGFLEGNQPILLSIFDLKQLLEYYSILADSFMGFYPQYIDRLEFIMKTSSEAQNEVERYTEIKLVPQDYVKVYWPNSWYITPSNFLYNTGGKKGHKDGNFINQFMSLSYFASQRLKPAFSNGSSANEKANEFLDRGYVSQEDFKNYSNLAYSFINIPTVDTERDQIRMEAFRSYYTEKTENDNTFSIEKYSEEEEEFFHGDIPVPIRSYQKNIITLVVGYLKAYHDFYHALARMNMSQREDIVSELLEFYHYDINDFLVSYCGFSKIESVLPKTITTSRLTVYSDFYHYLENGWNIHLIPPIIYNQDKDCIEQVNLDSIMVDRYLKKQEVDTEGLKGKVFVHKLHYMK